jgi:hypothetical protein
MQFPNARIVLLCAVIFAILSYLAILIAGGGFRVDPFADMDKKMNTFTLYYMKGCPHCETILPDYKAFSADGQYSSNGATTKIRMVEQGESSAAAELEALKISGFPTFYLSKSDGSMLEYKGDRSIPAMKTFISENAV